MLPCEKCAYKRHIPGDAHIQCVFNWDKLEIPKFTGGKKQQQWFIFPINFDPVWGGTDCDGFHSQSEHHTQPGESREITEVRK